MVTVTFLLEGELGGAGEITRVKPSTLPPVKDQSKYIVPLPNGSTDIHCGATAGGSKGVGLAVVKMIEVATIVEVELTVGVVELTPAVSD